MSKSKINPKGSSWDELEKQLLDLDISMIELMSVNDTKHLHFYEKFSFEKSNNLLVMSKFL